MDFECCYVILHYKALEETIMCIDSILNNIAHNSKIIVVDNYSNNGSIEEIEKKYKGIINIHIIKSLKNLGFANGNNLGYSFARDKLGAKYIIIMNNDIEIVDPNFEKIIKKEYQDNGYDIMGPKIILKDDTSYLYHRNINLKIAKKERKNCIIKKWILQLGMVNLYNKIIQKRQKKKKQNILNPNNRYEDIILHGSCLIFSPKYVNKFSEAFNKETFLYYEEELLYIKTIRYGLKTLYSPDTVVKHYEDAATNLECLNNERRKNIFKLRNQIKSLGIVIKELKKCRGVETLIE